MMFDRVEKVRKRMAEHSAEVLLLCPSHDLFYLTGINDRLMERLSCVVITRQDIVFVAPVFEIGNISADIRAGITCHGWTDGEDPFAILDGYLPQGEREALICGVAPAWILLECQRLRSGYHWSNADRIVQNMRMRKDDTEYKMMKDVQKRANNALYMLYEHGIEGLTEIEAGRILMQYCEQEGLEGEIPIVASGPNSALPHHHCSEKVIARGDVVVIDYVAADRTNGYQADTTRTVAVGTMPERLPEIYDIVMCANQAVFEASKPGVPCEQVDTAARDVISAAGYGKYFTHRLGHGLGLSVHEEPYMTQGNKMPIEQGFVYSDEPGIYMPGDFGVRIEDILFIHDDGAERLTAADHDLRVIG